VVVFCFGDISADDDDPKAARPSSPSMHGDPVSIEEAAGDTLWPKWQLVNPGFDFSYIPFIIVEFYESF
jgi:hypothetical protein